MARRLARRAPENFNQERKSDIMELMLEVEILPPKYILTPFTEFEKVKKCDGIMFYAFLRTPTALKS